ncbi:MAG: leucine--tRNA ligase [Saprospiraceae bacterium]|nr:leucine--tRNA ligase [Saprospiraceae bacterium]
MQEYNHSEIEQKWRQYWEDHQTYRVEEDESKTKYYVLDMFPYPSGAGLHVGHPLGYIASDIYARYKRLKGFNVLHPMGYDAFGLPAEQYAIETGIHPAKSTSQNIDRYRKQLSQLGFSFDWSREVRTCEPGYYKWTQWIFTQLFDHYYDLSDNKAVPISKLISTFDQSGNADVHAFATPSRDFTAAEWQSFDAKQQAEILMDYRLAYRRIGYVNWCEALGTVLANDQIKDGVSERGGHPVEKRAMTQWYLRITAYAERMLNDLAQIDWSESLKTMQVNWIGRSEGAAVFFDIVDHSAQIEVYTTRPDTIFGATFMVLAPEHPYVQQITTDDQREEVDAYLEYVKSRSERDRQAEVKTVTGTFTGAYAINPLNKAKVPIWIAEYVLMDYGTGAIMAVPSDDERDQKFSEKFGIEIIDVVDKSDYPGAGLHDKVGKMINSGFITGMQVPEAIEAVCQKVEDEQLGSRQVNFKMRDANFSRQRYWGEPFPIVYDDADIAHVLPIAELPVELPPSDDFTPTAAGESPLARMKDWVALPNGMKRETDTMPAVAGSSWYYLRYMDPHNDESFVATEKVNYWKDVDLYIGGAEHAVSHLMYARFWHKFLYDLQLVPTAEPFKKLINQGMIQGVIESVLLDKDPIDGKQRFVCAKLAAARGDADFARIPVKIEFVNDYGSDESHLDLAGIQKFIDWRSTYQDAIFECIEGEVINGVFHPRENAVSPTFYTHSEVGKMSKSKYNVINPDDVINRYGTDCFRMYEMFLGPLENSKPWDTNGIDGVSKFIKKCWRLFFDLEGRLTVSDENPSKDELRILHQTIKKVEEDIERHSFNTCISHFMVAVNQLRAFKTQKRAIAEALTILLAPFAPHLAEELWQRLGHLASVHQASFPTFEAEHLVVSEISYPISINGKKRAEASFAANASKEDVEREALALDSIQKWIDGKTVRKVIVVPKRMINIVVG